MDEKYDSGASGCHPETFTLKRRNWDRRKLL
jgi:hypothetical protein